MTDGRLSWVGVGLLSVAMAWASGCAKPHARYAPEGPPLQVPEPPPRVVRVVEDIPQTPAQDTPPSGAPAVPPRQSPPRAARPPQPKSQEPPPVEAPVPAAVPPVVERVEPTRTLRAQGDETREKAIRDRLSQAATELGKVDYGKLSTSAREQYEQSRRFIQQAEQALKDQNLVFAGTLADKAATLAADLPNR